MYLKRLEIQGFKSFADKINLEFNSGITSIVGPNGSGKSNIADAVRWVLGEQSVKNLRGSRMEDVIFAGTEHRKSVGFAEVSLTIDNADGKLQVDYSEVTITRRVFRSGESEYFINKTPCRLKDINELFFDTGIGKDGYSIIGQGRVDEILSNKSEDRRLIFEEASGIMKYKVRKIEAEKKLELTKQNLMRINDIINELENQLEPLKQQSETAKRYLNLRENLKELEVNVFIENISRLKEKINECEIQYTSIRENIDEENNKLENTKNSNKQKTDLLKSLEEKLNEARQIFYNIDGEIERYQSEIRLNDEKVNNLLQNIHRIDNEMAELNKKVENHTQEESEKKRKIEYLNKKHTEYYSKLDEYEKQMEEVLSSLSESERHIEILKSSIMDKLDILSDKKTQVNNVKLHMEGLVKRQNSIKNEIQEISLENDRNNMKKEDLQDRIRITVESIKCTENKLDTINKDKGNLEYELANERKNQSVVKSDMQYKSSRYKMLKDMEQNLEGYNKSVKVILQACQRSVEFGRGIHGALAQLMKVEQKFETAIEMALGSALQNIVTTNEEDAKRAIEYLKKNKLGRATFLPVSAVKGRYLDDDTTRIIKQQNGFCGIASDLVSCNSEYRGIILNLLGKVVVAENLDAGIKMAKNFGYGFRIVTVDGDIINTSGSMTGGSWENKGTGILSRNREIEELQNEINRLKKEEVKYETNIVELIGKINNISKELSSLENDIKNSELEKIRDESNLAQLDESIKKSAARIEMLRQEKNQLMRQEVETEKELEKYVTELNQIENEIAETKKIVSEHQDKHKEEQTVRDSLHTAITDFKISVNSIQESLNSVKESIDRIIAERDMLEKSINKKCNEKNKNNIEIDNLKERNSGLMNLVKRQEEEKHGKTFEIDRITDEKKVIEEELYDIVNKMSEINKNIMLLQEEFNKIEVKKAKQEAELEAVQNRMWDEYELTFNNALGLKKDIGSISQAQKKISELKNQIRELGPVNVTAIDEYIKTKERYEFMSVQKNDMEQAKEKLHKMIYEMTLIMKKQFMEQFKLINENFNIVFRQLFDGGRAELILVDKENVLESGIEIEVQPPGKKLQNMMLLSGGERAFTAIALLFAILRLRPTPFCILDEIEAALDDANVYKFSEYLRTYSQQTQFIMVTHRKGTMEGSDMLYGVTMQEHGISKVVSLKLEEKVS